MHAVLKNHSETGAFIEFSDTVLLPNEFTMHNELDGYRVDCRVVRRSGNTAGVTFISAESTAVMVCKQVVSVPNLRTVESTEDIEFEGEKVPIVQPALKPRPVLSPTVRRTFTFGRKGITYFSMQQFETLFSLRY